jgi:oligopeptidase B
MSDSTSSPSATIALAPVQPPTARRDPTPTTLHGVTLEDDYGWMRDKSSPELLAHLRAENAYTSSVMAPTESLQARLYTEMLSHIKETDESVPYRLGDWFYSTRTVEGSQYAIHCRYRAVSSDVDSPLDPTQPEQIILDINKLAEGHPFMSVGGMAVSPDGNLLAYSTDSTGFRQYTLHIRDLRTGADLSDTARARRLPHLGGRLAQLSSTPPRTRPPSAWTASSATSSARRQPTMSWSITSPTSASTSASARPATDST